MSDVYEVRREDFYFNQRQKLQAKKHLHQHVELVVMLEGASHAWADTRGGLLKAGQAFIAFPNQMHHYLDDCGPFRGQIFIFSPDLLTAFYSTFTKRVPVDPIVSLDMLELRPVLDLLAAEDRNTNKDKYTRSLMEGCLGIILSHMFRRMQWEDVDQHNISATRAILGYCNANYTSDISLEDVAKNTHRSKYYVSHIFSKEIGTSFPAYINSLRIHDAKELLKAGDLSVTEVAYAVGFSSLRSFNRCFLAATGQNPSAFRRDMEKTLDTTDDSGCPLC